MSSFAEELAARREEVRRTSSRLLASGLAEINERAASSALEDDDTTTHPLQSSAIREDTRDGANSLYLTHSKKGSTQFERSAPPGTADTLAAAHSGEDDKLTGDSIGNDTNDNRRNLTEPEPDPSNKRRKTQSEGDAIPAGLIDMGNRRSIARLDSTTIGRQKIDMGLRPDPATDYQTVVTSGVSRPDWIKPREQLLPFLQKCQKSMCPENVGALRNQIHQMEFSHYSRAVIKRSSICERDCLPKLYEDPRFPWDVRADAEHLCARWKWGDTDPHLYRGVNQDMLRKANKKTRLSALLMDYAVYPYRQRCDYAGAGDLQNGQWWPAQLCTKRDGAHGNHEAGIHGTPDLGACSIILSSGGYDDQDNGEVIEYCGTKGKEEENNVTPSTTLMLRAKDVQTPVRVLRSSKMEKSNKYRPQEGIRYDGLYLIVGQQLLDANRNHFRFHLERIAGQDPIRFEGDERRPTDREVQEFHKHKGMLKGIIR